MISKIGKRTLPVCTAIVVMLVGASGARAGEPPIKEILTSHIGAEVDKTTKGNVCTVVSKDECQPGMPSSQPGGFEHAESVAGAPAPSSNVYVADRDNHRIQEITAAGAFFAAFGWDVNKTKDETPGAEQAEKNVCTAASGDVCQAGVEGSALGQFGSPQDVAVDPASGDIYVAELIFGENGKSVPFRERVQKFTAEGRFVLEIGKEVNETKDKQATATIAEKNLCTEEEVEKGVKCIGPAAGTGSAPGAFAFTQGNGGLLAVGGPEDHLYVGGAEVVQEFEADGKYKREIGAGASAISVDKAGDVYLVSAGSNVIREFDQSGKEIKIFTLVAREQNGAVEVLSIALDSTGRLAVSEVESGKTLRFRGGLYEVGAAGLHLITEFVGQVSTSLAFNSNEDLYVAGNLFPGKYEVLGYSPVLVGELGTGSASCVPGAEHETDVTLDCHLEGEVNPEGVSETDVWFQWGTTCALGTDTPKQPIGEGTVRVKVAAEVQGVLPNEAMCYRLAGEDHTVKVPELLTGEKMSFTTLSVPPRTVGQPSVSYVHSTSAVMFGELNPENASTRYDFEYVSDDAYVKDEACSKYEASCPGLGSTAPEESATYGQIATTQEATGLQPATLYHYRLFALNEKSEAAVNEKGEPQLAEGTFQTRPAPAPQAVTGPFSALGTTSAIISGTVNPDGAPATYAFELGIYNGANTRYGIVFSGPVATSTNPVEQTLGLSGLQPGTTYAYRIAISSGYIKTEGRTTYGDTHIFTTNGLPVVLPAPPPPAQLAIPPLKFPKTPVTPKTLTRAQKLARALAACHKQPKTKRAMCRRNAHKRYALPKTNRKKK